MVQPTVGRLKGVMVSINPDIDMVCPVQREGMWQRVVAEWWQVRVVEGGPGCGLRNSSLGSSECGKTRLAGEHPR